MFRCRYSNHRMSKCQKNSENVEALLTAPPRAAPRNGRNGRYGANSLVLHLVRVEHRRYGGEERQGD
jgi:hypothetical protein